MSRIPLLAAVLLIVALPVRAVCTLNVRYVSNPPALVWDDVAGVKTYQVQESFDNFITSHNYFPKTPPFAIQHRASADTKAYYTVTAIMQSNVLSYTPAVEGCTEQLIVTLKGDPQFRATMRRAVVPIVGSGPGAYGGRFKTSLHLHSTTPNERGKLIFHPAGKPGSADDPSIAYVFGAGVHEDMFFDDVVAAIGQTGIGSLDIVPDEGASDSVPLVEARLYNDTPAGTFGTTTRAFYPFDFREPTPMRIDVLPSDAPFRINVGVRTITATKAYAMIYGTNGRIKEFFDLSGWPADTMVLSPINQLIGRDLVAGEYVTLFFDGVAIPFYTRTENRTNDPELFVVDKPQPTNVSAYVE